MPEALAPKPKCCYGVCHGGMLQISNNVRKQQPNYRSNSYMGGSGVKKVLLEEGVTT